MLNKKEKKKRSYTELLLGVALLESLFKLHSIFQVKILTKVHYTNISVEVDYWELRKSNI